MSLVKNIFLVDDDATFVFMTKKIIKSTAIDSEIKVFSDGEAAIDFLKDHIDHTEPLPDVIFLDLNMPIMDGWGFLEEYVSLEPKMKKKVKLYIVSSSISPHEIEHAKQFSSVTDFIIKPLVKEKFIEIIENL
jgi:CheY-like chemotaxis protein